MCACLCVVCVCVCVCGIGKGVESVRAKVCTGTVHSSECTVYMYREYLSTFALLPYPVPLVTIATI